MVRGVPPSPLRHGLLSALVPTVLAGCLGGADAPAPPLPPLPDAAALGDALVTVPGCAPRALAAGEHHTCALIASGAVYCWGDNARGELGRDPGTPAALPLRVALPRPAAQLTAARGRTCARTIDGALYCWGQAPGSPDSAPALQPPTRVALPGNAADAAAGGAHVCALLATGAALCLGQAAQVGDGQLDRDPGPRVQATLIAPHAGTPDRPVPRLRALAAGRFHTCALELAGTVSCWGLDPELGDAAAVHAPVPTPAPALGGGVITLVAAGRRTCGVHGDGSVSCQPPLPAAATLALGQGNLTVAPGTQELCVLKRSGRVACVVGEGDVEELAAPIGSTSLGPAALVAGAEHRCAITDGGQVACWGRGREGQLGHGRFSDSATPVAVELPQDCPFLPTPGP